MNLTIEQVSKLTKLSVPTLYTYASRQKLGKKVGNKRVFSQADVQKLRKSARKSVHKSKRITLAKRTSKKTIKTESVKALKTKPTKSAPSSVAGKPQNPSFWGRLFGNRSRRS